MHSGAFECVDVDPFVSVWCVSRAVTLFDLPAVFV